MSQFEVYDIHYPTPLPADHYQVGVVVMVWNRPMYLRRFLRSLSKCHMDDTIVMLVDDNSVDPETQRLIRDYQHASVPIIKCYASYRRRYYIHRRLRYAWNFLSDVYGCEYLTNLDSDVIMHPDWLNRVRELYQRETEKRGRIIISGFNKHFGVSLEEQADHNVRRFVGGANLFFDVDVYHEIVRDAMRKYWDDYVVEAMYKSGYACLTIKPSCIQHIGFKGLFSSYLRHDFASDYSFWSHFHPLRVLVGIKRILLGTNPLWFLSRESRESTEHKH